MKKKNIYTPGDLHRQARKALVSSRVGEGIRLMAFAFLELPESEQTVIARLGCRLANSAPDLSPLGALEALYKIGRRVGA